MQARLFFIVCGLAVAASTAFAAPDRIDPPPPPREPVVAAASDEPAKAAAGFGLPAGFAVECFAAEPDVANAIAFSIDERGRVFVCEAFRALKGVGDNTGKEGTAWLEADLAAKTVDDRLAYHLRLLGEKAREWVVETDRLEPVRHRQPQRGARQRTDHAHHDGLREHRAVDVAARLAEREPQPDLPVAPHPGDQPRVPQHDRHHHQEQAEQAAQASTSSPKSMTKAASKSGTSSNSSNKTTLGEFNKSKGAGKPGSSSKTGGIGGVSVKKGRSYGTGDNGGEGGSASEQALYAGEVQARLRTAWNELLAAEGSSIANVGSCGVTVSIDASGAASFSGWLSKPGDTRMAE